MTSLIIGCGGRSVEVPIADELADKVRAVLDGDWHGHVDIAEGVREMRYRIGRRRFRRYSRVEARRR